MCMHNPVAFEMCVHVRVSECMCDIQYTGIILQLKADGAESSKGRVPFLPE